MNRSIAGVIVMLALPTVVFIGGGLALAKLSGRQIPDGFKPLNRRWSGYNADEAACYWSAAERKNPGAERRFLEMDLVFPFLYGGALAAGLLIGWALLGRLFSPAWLLAPVVIALIADWTENLAQINQLGRFPGRLQESCIRIASMATVTKMIFLNFSGFLLFGLCVWWIWSSLQSRG